jgi:hypothetical protein
MLLWVVACFLPLACILQCVLVTSPLHVPCVGCLVGTVSGRGRGSGGRLSAGEGSTEHRGQICEQGPPPDPLPASPSPPRLCPAGRACYRWLLW